MADSRMTKSGKPRKAPKPRSVFGVFQVTDDAGNPISFDKARLNVIGGTRDTETLLSVLDSGTYPHAFYRKIENMSE